MKEWRQMLPDLFSFLQKEQEILKNIFAKFNQKLSLQKNEVLEICKNNNSIFKNLIKFNILETNNNFYNLNYGFKAFFEEISKDKVQNNYFITENNYLQSFEIQKKNFEALKQNRKNFAKVNEILFFLSREIQKMNHKVSLDISQIRTKLIKSHHLEIEKKEKILKNTYDELITPLKNFLDNSFYFDFLQSILKFSINETYQEEIVIAKKFQDFYYFCENIYQNLVNSHKIINKDFIQLFKVISSNDAVFRNILEFLSNKNSDILFFKKLETKAFSHQNMEKVRLNLNLNKQEKIFRNNANITYKEQIKIDNNFKFLKEKLFFSLPVDNFFEWILSELNKNNLENLESINVFKYTAILFDKSLKISFSENKTNINLNHRTFKVPTIKVNLKSQ
jgi:hypothetical protein